MRATTLRRSLVFAVCAIGVGCLYLAPGVARPPDQLESNRASDEPTAQPTGPSVLTTPTSAGAGTGSPQRSQADPGPGTAAESGGDDPEHPAPSPSAARTAEHRTGRAPTAYDPEDTADDELPQAVRQIKTEKVTADRLGLSWSPAQDNVRVVGYHVWLNGFEVASTAETHVSVRWFNDDTSTHVVQVKAVDGAGNESATSPSVLVSRPEPTPEPTTTAPDPSTGPRPSSEPSASEEPTTGPHDAPNEPQAAPTTEPTGAPNGAS